MRIPFIGRRKAPETKSTPKTPPKPLPRAIKANRGAWGGAESSRLVASWFTQGTPINQEIERDLTALRTRSRDLAKNSDYIRRFFQMAKSNVVGPTGFKMTSQVTRSSGKPDDPARHAIEQGWKEFSAKGVPCAQDRLSLWDIQNVATESLFRDGEIILLQYTGSDENKFGLSFKFVDPQSLDVNHKGDHGGNPVKMGIETDSRGRVIAYHFKSTDTTHKAYYETGGKGAIRVAAKHVIHRFLIEYADQIRGVPHLAAAMFRLKMLDEYESAELVASRLAASTMGFIERGEDGGSFEGVNAVGDYEEDFDEYPEEPQIEAESGAFHYIENGAKVHQWSGDHAPTAYGPFVKGILRGIASSLGVSYNSLANDLEGVNYSSIRQAVLEDRDFWKAVQNWMIENILDEIFDRWLEASLLRDVLVMPSGKTLNSAHIDRYRARAFAGRRWQWVDPLKDISAHEKALTLKIRSRSSIIREQGDDPADVWREIAEEEELLKSLGITTEPQEPPNNEQTNTDGETDPDN
ncbi:Phage portal protein, lambda family [Pseudoalteromonas sp. THAF3]|uniref:phage portal protein n=1 Tax=Pseudoalteromonas sp. THAF3 TaxID=2587843 RepID=UPI0012682C3B|nr:phage portal protein [Pseudoalteromonas sp. THAF3]QFU04583.1 Phage portal protein, lambda family [Pseudoalteromonas sp. THAF3]